MAHLKRKSPPKKSSYAARRAPAKKPVRKANKAGARARTAREKGPKSSARGRTSREGVSKRKSPKKAARSSVVSRRRKPGKLTKKTLTKAQFDSLQGIDWAEIKRRIDAGKTTKR